MLVIDGGFLQLVSFVYNPSSRLLYNNFVNMAKNQLNPARISDRRGILLRNHHERLALPTGMETRPSCYTVHHFNEGGVSGSA